MRALLAALGDPQEAYPAIHVVGTNGKSTRRDHDRAAAPRRAACASARTISPHVAGWRERIRLDGREADFEARVGRVRPAAERSKRRSSRRSLLPRSRPSRTPPSTSRSSRRVSAAGTTRRTCFDARVVLLTNVGLEHTDVLGDTLEAIATEKLAVARPGVTVVLPDRT